MPRPLVLDSFILAGFFDKEYQNDGSKCGVSVVLKISNSISFKVKMNYCPGMNSIGELLALWYLFFFARQKQVSRLQIVGD